MTNEHRSLKLATIEDLSGTKVFVTLTEIKTDSTCRFMLLITNSLGAFIKKQDFFDLSDAIGTMKYDVDFIGKLLRGPVVYIDPTPAS